VGPCTKSGFEFRQSSFTLRERVLRMPCPTTLSDMHRFPGMLGPLWLSPPGMPVTQEQFPSSSCFQQGYHNAPHGAHCTCTFRCIQLSGRSFRCPLSDRLSCMDRLMAEVANDQGLSPASRHDFDPMGSYSPSLFQISQLVDVMNFYVFS